jgi:hypothetical protein
MTEIVLHSKEAPPSSIQHYGWHMETVLTIDPTLSLTIRRDGESEDVARYLSPEVLARSLGILATEIQADRDSYQWKSTDTKSRWNTLDGTAIKRAVWEQYIPEDLLTTPSPDPGSYDSPTGWAPGRSPSDLSRVTMHMDVSLRLLLEFC